MKARRKGYRNEHALEELLNFRGIETKRIPMSGQHAHTGDLIHMINGKKMISEVKAWARNFPEYKMLGHADFVFKKTTKDGMNWKTVMPWLVVMDLETFIGLVNGHE